jgi:hypothetical protein
MLNTEAPQHDAGQRFDGDTDTTARRTIKGTVTNVADRSGVAKICMEQDHNGEPCMTPFETHCRKHGDPTTMAMSVVGWLTINTQKADQETHSIATPLIEEITGIKKSEAIKQTQTTHSGNGLLMRLLEDELLARQVTAELNDQDCIVSLTVDKRN